MKYFFLPLLAIIAGCALEPPEYPFETGVASWYGQGFHGRLTASGEVYDMNKLTAAHPTLPFGTKVKVVVDRKWVVVRINDRGPFVKDRIIDLSKRAADVLGFTNAGIAHVELYEVNAPGDF